MRPASSITMHEHNRATMVNTRAPRRAETLDLRTPQTTATMEQPESNAGTISPKKSTPGWSALGRPEDVYIVRSFHVARATRAITTEHRMSDAAASPTTLRDSLGE